MAFLCYLFAVLKNVIYGLSVNFTGSLTENVDFLDVLSLRFLMSAVIMWLLKTLRILKINIGVKDFLCKEKRSSALKYLLFAALFEPVLEIFFETWGISMTTGITAAVILSLLPVAVCVAEAIFLKEHTTLLQKVFLAAGICGVIYISLNTTASGGKDSVAGILLLILGNIMGALYFVFSRKSSKNYSAMEITYTSACMGMVAFNLVNIVRHLIAGNIGSYFAPYMSVENLIGFFFLAVVCTIFATAMNNFALSGMQASTMSAFSGLSTFVTIIAGVIFNNETLYYFHYIGLSLILVRMVGVSIIQIKKDKK